MPHFIDNILQIPKLDLARLRFQSLAMLDAILMPEWEHRYFSFNAKWGPDEMMASMRNGEGDEYFFLFCKHGAVGKVYCHELPVEKPAAVILERIPSQFDSFLTEEAFRLDSVTCCLWQTTGNPIWEISPPNKTSVPLLAFIKDQGDYYREWAERYYEQSVPRSIVMSIFEHQPLTNEILAQLPQMRSLTELVEAAEEIGYQTA